MITGDRKKALWRHTASSAYVNCRWPFSRGSRADGRPLWYSLRSGSSMISCRVGHTNGSSRTGPGFSRIWESYRIFFVRIRGSFILHHLSSWLDINLQECSGSPPNRQRGKKVFTVRLRVGGKAKKTWLSVNFTSGFFLWACAVHIPKRNWLEKKINNVQSRTHPTPSFCIQPGFVRASFLEFVRIFFYLFISEALLQFLFSISFSHICNHFALSLRYTCLCRIIFPFVQISHSWGTFASDRIDNDFLKNYIFLFCSDSYFK